MSLLQQENKKCFPSFQNYGWKWKCFHSERFQADWHWKNVPNWIFWIDCNCEHNDLMVNINYRLHLVTHRFEWKITMDLLKIIILKVSRCPDMGLFMSAWLVGKGCNVWDWLDYVCVICMLSRYETGPVLRPPRSYRTVCGLDGL